MQGRKSYRSPLTSDEPIISLFYLGSRVCFPRGVRIALRDEFAADLQVCIQQLTEVIERCFQESASYITVKAFSLEQLFLEQLSHFVLFHAISCCFMPFYATSYIILRQTRYLVNLLLIGVRFCCSRKLCKLMEVITARDGIDARDPGPEVPEPVRRESMGDPGK